MDNFGKRVNIMDWQGGRVAVSEKPSRMLLLVTLVAFVAAKPDPAGIFDSVRPQVGNNTFISQFHHLFNSQNFLQGRVSEEVSVARMLKDSGVTTLEKTLENASPCMAMALCRHGATKAMAKEDAFYVAMKTFTAFLKSVQEASTRSTKNIDTLTGALRVGAAMGEGACRSLYPCPESESQIQGRRGEVCLNFQPRPL